MSKEITITITQLEILLDQQKEIVADRLMQNTLYYHADSKDPIDKNRFKDIANMASYPHDFKVLKKYIR